MAASYFLVQRNRTGLVPTKNSVDQVIVVAEDSTEAKQMAASFNSGDGNTAWNNATVTTLAAASNLDGFVLRVQLFNTSGVRVEDVSVTGVSSATIDSIAALMVTALNATATLAGAAYNSSTQVLKIADATTDAIGNFTFVITLTPPIATHGDPQNLSGWFASHTDGGMAAADLKVTLGADTRTLPKVFGAGKQS